MIAAIGSREISRANSTAATSLVLNQPSVATCPSRASIPTAKRPGNARHMSRNQAGSFNALVPITSRVRPRSSICWMVCAVANTSPQFAGNLNRSHNRFDGGPIHTAAVPGTVEVHQVQARGALGNPTASHRGRIVSEHRLAAVVTLQQSHALAAAKIDCGPDFHPESPELTFLPDKTDRPGLVADGAQFPKRESMPKYGLLGKYARRKLEVMGSGTVAR